MKNNMYHPISLGHSLSLVIILFSLSFLASCERRSLEDELHNSALIPVSIIWSDAGLDPDNDPNHDIYSASVWLFSKDGSLIFGDKSYREYRLSNPQGGEIEVPLGRYQVIIFNNTIEDFSSNVAFRGTDSYSTFEYYSKEDTRSRYVRAEGENVVLEPDILAGWHLDDFEVTSDMISRSRSQARSRATNTDSNLQSLLNVHPALLTPRISVKEHVKGIISALNANGIIKGMGSSVFLSTGLSAPPPSTFIFPLSNRQLYKESTDDGTIEANFNSFGPLVNLSNAHYELQTTFTLTNLYNGSQTYPTPPAAPFTFDITGQVEQATQIETCLNIEIEVGLEVGQDIILPTQASGGFGIGISDWEEIEIPIN